MRQGHGAEEGYPRALQRTTTSNVEWPFEKGLSTSLHLQQKQPAICREHERGCQNPALKQRRTVQCARPVWPCPFPLKLASPGRLTYAKTRHIAASCKNRGESRTLTAKNSVLYVSRSLMEQLHPQMTAAPLESFDKALEEPARA